MEAKVRLKQAFDYLRLNNKIQSQKDLAEKMGATCSNVSKALNGDVRFLTGSFIARFCREFPRISAHWIETGEGTMLTDGAATVGGNVVIGNTAGRDIKVGGGVHDAVVEERSEEVPVIPRALYEDTEVDVMEYITHNDVQTSPKVEQFPRYAAYYVVYGDEMTPDFRPGDKLAIAPYDIGMEHKALDGRAYVIDTRYNGLLLRILYKMDGGGFRAVPLNERYREETIDKDDVMRVYRVLGLIRTNV